MTYTTVDSPRRVVVSVVVSTSVVANCVAVGVGTQSPILPPRHGCFSSRRNQEQGKTLVVWYKSILPWLRGGSPSRLPFLLSAEKNCRGPSLPSRRLAPRPHDPPPISALHITRVFLFCWLGPPRTYTGQQPRSEQT